MKWIPLQINIQMAVAEMEIKQVHVISSSEGEKKERVGEGEKSSEERGRRHGGNHGYRQRWQGDDAQIDQDRKNGRQDDRR